MLFSPFRMGINDGFGYGNKRVCMNAVRMPCRMYVWIAFIFVKTSFSLKCPRQCACRLPEETGSYMEIDCGSKGLIDIPTMNSTSKTAITLSLKNNSFENVTLRNEHFENTKIRQLDISDNTFMKIDQDAFTGLDASLVILNANNIGTGMNFIDHVSTLSNLEEFSFRNNIAESEDFPEGYFTKSSLRYLDLSDNNLAYIADRAFVNIAESLEVLILNNAGITFSDIQFLRGLSNLKTLSIDGTDDAQLLNYVFKNLELLKLRSLSIRNGEILVIRSFAFEGIENLEILDLSNNKLKLVPSDALSLLPNLQTLNLSSNRDIESIVQGAFDGLQVLDTLDLRGTGINLIQGGGLASSLKHLILQNCSLPGDSFFLVDSFKKLAYLEILDLSYNNKLSRIYNSTFDYLSKLRVLDLSGNKMLKLSDTVIKGLEDGLQVLKLNNMALSSLPVEIISSLANLQRLEFSGNNLVELPANCLGYQVEGQLSELDLTNNNISNVDKRAFINIKKNFTLQIDNNNIGNLQFVKNYGTCFFKDLSIAKNPITCQCEIQSAVESICGEVTGTCYLGNNTYKDLNSDFTCDEINNSDTIRHSILHLVVLMLYVPYFAMS